MAARATAPLRRGRHPAGLATAPSIGRGAACCGRSVRRAGIVPELPGNLETELRRLSFIPMVVVGDVGSSPFDPPRSRGCPRWSPTATNGCR